MNMKIAVCSSTLLTSLAALCASSNAVSSTSDAAKVLTFSSGDQRVTLLELYTSEGCSSCPPADAWLGNLVEHPDLWREIVPVAFHVDYWDGLGWKDQLGNPAHGTRQRRYKQTGAASAVYTPGFVVNGREWRGWFNGERLPEPGSTVGGQLSARLQADQLCVTYTHPSNPKEPLTLEVAVMGFDITNNIKRGENRGRALTHQFAVLSHATSDSQDNQWCHTLELQGWPSQTLGVAVWVTRTGSPEPLQATGTWLHSGQL